MRFYVSVLQALPQAPSSYHVVCFYAFTNSLHNRFMAFANNNAYFFFFGKMGVRAKTNLTRDFRILLCESSFFFSLLPFLSSLFKNHTFCLHMMPNTKIQCDENFFKNLHKKNCFGTLFYIQLLTPI